MHATLNQHDSRLTLSVAVALGATILLLTVVALALQPSVSTLPVASFVDRFNLLLGGAVGFGLPGAVIAALRPANRIGWLAAGIGLVSAVRWRPSSTASSASIRTRSCPAPDGRSG